MTVSTEPADLAKSWSPGELPPLREDLSKTSSSGSRPGTSKGGSRRKEVFIALSVTLQELDTHQQTFTITGYANALWQYPDLEDESLRNYDGVYQTDGGSSTPHVKELVERHRTQTSIAKGIRQYVDGFKLRYAVPLRN